MKRKLSTLVKYHIFDNETDQVTLVEQEKAAEMIKNDWRNLTDFVKELIKPTDQFDEPLQLEEIQALVERDRDDELPFIVANDYEAFMQLKPEEVEIDL